MTDLLFFWRPRFRFHSPRAEAVSLVIDGCAKPFPMRRKGQGTWVVRPPTTRRALHGAQYHFIVHQDGHSHVVADPRAPRVHRLGERLASRFADLRYRWGDSDFSAPPARELIIYETHLPALSRHPSADVADESHRGTYVGARSPSLLTHLQRLGVGVEWMPLHASDHLLGQDWGYFTTAFNALTGRYALHADNANLEVKALVDAMHQHGISVLLDVVFNHGGETLALAWGHDVVYRRGPDGNFCHGSGCGPTIQTEHPLMRETIIEALQDLVFDYHIDGFRFDLGALHDVETMLEIDRRLPPRTYLIAEPWALGGVQWGKGDMAGAFRDTRWAIWNDDYREPGRRFILGNGDLHNRDHLMRAITGSNVADGGWAVRPQQSINYLSSHDGLTLADVVGGDERRQFLGVMLLMTSQGIPMIYEGTELMFSKQNEHNTYDRPDLNQLDWSAADTHRHLITAVGDLIRLRKQLPHFSYTGRLRPRVNGDDDWDIDWIFPNGYPHSDNVNAIGFVLRSPPRFKLGRKPLVVLLNGSHEGVEFTLPPGDHRILVDGARIAVNARGLGDHPPARDQYFVHPGSGVVLQH